MSALTIVTPTLNAASTLRATLESVRPLVCAGARHIVVDSGSTDETADLARASGATVLVHPPGSMYAAINEGMRRAKGEWLTYINGDDLLYADAIFAALEEYGPRADFIYGNLDHIDLHGRFLFSWRSPAPQRLTWLMQHYCPFPQQGMLFRREAFEKLEGFDLRFRFSADYDFFLRAVEHGCRFSKWTQSSVAAFRLSPGQLSQRLRGEMAPEGRVIREGLRMRRPGMNARFGRMAATLYRWCTNADSMLLRAWRGRNQDAAWRR